jgi:hypothetical protein
MIEKLSSMKVSGQILCGHGHRSVEYICESAKC